jgi:alkyl hydroperoxide reductase subunit F
MNQFPIDQKIGDKVSRVEKTTRGFKATLESGEKYESTVAILTTGKRSRKLNVPGETEFTGRGVTYCAICDGPVFAGQRVAVVGGGNSALEAALDMVKIAEYVNLISLTPLTGDTVLIERLKGSQNLSIFLEYETERIEGDNFVSGIVVKDLKNGKSQKLEVVGVFIEIGLVPNSEPVKGLVELNQQGEVIVNCASETSVPGLYAAGDVTNVPEKQIVVAAGEGAKAVLQVHRYLQRLTA